MQHFSEVIYTGCLIHVVPLLITISKTASAARLVKLLKLELYFLMQQHCVKRLNLFRRIFQKLLIF